MHSKAPPENGTAALFKPTRQGRSSERLACTRSRLAHKRVGPHLSTAVRGIRSNAFQSSVGRVRVPLDHLLRTRPFATAAFHRRSSIRRRSVPKAPIALRISWCWCRSPISGFGLEDAIQQKLEPERDL